MSDRIHVLNRASDFDVIIVGAGPAGLGAALYTARDRLKTLLLERMIPGGQIFTTTRVENYPGIVRTDGQGLIEQMQKQVESFGAGIRQGCDEFQDGGVQGAAYGLLDAVEIDGTGPCQRSVEIEKNGFYQKRFLYHDSVWQPVDFRRKTSMAG